MRALDLKTNENYQVLQYYYTGACFDNKNIFEGLRI